MIDNSVDTEDTVPYNDTYVINRKSIELVKSLLYKGVIQIEARDTEDRDIVVELTADSPSREGIEKWLEDQTAILEGKLDLISPKKRK